MLKGKLASEVVNERQQYINCLKQFILDKKEKLQSVLDELHLTEESLSKIEVKQICPFDQNHSVPERSFKKHVEKCRLQQAGLQQDEMPSQLQNLDICYEGTQVVKVNIDESLLNKIIWDECAQSGQVYTGHRTMPVSHVDEAVNLTQTDRLAVYSHIVKVSHDAGGVIPVDRTDQLLTTDWGQLVKKGMLNEQNNQQYKSKLEQLAAIRDMKRRRQSYRAKNVHVTKKSYTEIIREVIVNQMEILTPEEENSSSQRKDFEEKGSSRDRKRKHRDRDDSRERSSFRRERSRERSRERKYDRKDRKSRDQHNIEKRERSFDERLSRHQGFSDPVDDRLNDNFDDVKKETDPHDQSYTNISATVQSDRESISHKGRHSESSLSSNTDEDYHHKRKHKKKSKHKKKHSKKHKK